MSGENRQFGYNSRLLRVDLTQRKHFTQEIPYEVLRTYVVGSALGGYFLLMELQLNVDPLDPSNLLIISTSPITTFKAPGLSMFSISFKSPLTGFVGEVLTPGFMGYQLKRCGYDVLIISGRSNLPTYVCVTDSGVEVALKCYEAVAGNGMDGASLGGTLAFAIGCFEKGLINESQTGGIRLRFGNGDAILRLIELIVRREGFGDILARGSKKASELIGEGAINYAMQSKGLELPMHEPMAKAMLGLGYAVSPVGPNYVVVEHNTDFDFNAPELFMEQIAPLGLTKGFESTDLSIGKIRLYFYMGQVFSSLNVLCACIYASAPVRFYSFANLVNLFNSITSWETSLFEFMKAGERKNNLNRLFAYREGFSGKDDVLPERVFEPIESGTKAGYKLSRDNFYEMVKFYYDMAGWDFKIGKPDVSKLVELGIEFA